MRKTARFLKGKGFTLIEFTLVMAILVILSGLSTPYLFGAKEKALLEKERDQIVNSLKLAQQKAIAAYKGYDYTVVFNQTGNQYRLPEEGKTVNLSSRITITSVQPTTIKFLRLTGEPESPLKLVLVSKRFETTIRVSQEGITTVTPPERR